ncbi:MAG TPA: hypothetical protein VFK16_06340 [Gemmatimonadaceae bacterium]|nr:hypothetical protein [Gemmatimonadaceae bacterium]
MNSKLAGSRTTGEARFTIQGDRLTIAITVHGTVPNIVHWQHIHGFKDGRAATCPGAGVDANHDGVVDLMETSKASGVTMVPFITDPVSLDIAHGTYPKADAEGNYTYQETVSLAAMNAAMAKAYPGQKLDLAKRVVYVHTVPADTHLASTVATLGPIPAQITLPLACGTIERATP